MLIFVVLLMIKLGFYESDCISRGIISDDLQAYIKNIKMNIHIS